MFLLVLAIGSAACVSTGPVLPAGVSERTELDDVGFFPQLEHQCGPAALATLLSASGVRASAAELTREVYLPGRQGSLQVELGAALRRRERIAYPLVPTMAALVAEVTAGRPVLVLQNLGVVWWPRWHYAVVVGFDRTRDVVVLRSGTERRRLTPARVFDRTWVRSGRFGLVALTPGQLPAHLDATAYFAAAAALETVGSVSPDAAQRMYAALTARAPQLAEGWFGLGNVQLANGRPAAAVEAYARAIAAAGGNHTGARNNRVMALLRLGCVDRARKEASALYADTPQNDPLYADIVDTVAEARMARPAQCALPR